MRIDGLIERDFFARDESDRGIIKYIAWKIVNN